MSNFFAEEPPTVRAEHDYFGPRPEELMRKLEDVKEMRGVNSFEYASALVKLGDSHRIQSQRGAAQRCYEEALQIVEQLKDSSAETAFIHDKLASLRESETDYSGAVQHLTRALDIWNTLNTNERHVDDAAVQRRVTDLERLKRVLALQTRMPPEL